METATPLRTGPAALWSRLTGQTESSTGTLMKQQQRDKGVPPFSQVEPGLRAQDWELCESWSVVLRP